MEAIEKDNTSLRGVLPKVCAQEKLDKQKFHNHFQNSKMRTAFFILCILFASVLNAQRVDIAINNYTTKYPVESVYLQLDNSLYAAADTIWFKAYILANMFPSAFSKNLYADWYDEKGKLILQQVYPVQQGAAVGQFAIPENYTGNKLHLLAYTRWMLNADSAFLFHKDINLLSASKKVAPQKAILPQKTILHFFPEGGNMVSGIKNKIAFKATDDYGNPVSFGGVIKDNDGNTITTFASSYDGMGFFYLIPKNGENYTAEWQTQQGVFSSVDLPGAQLSGLTMEVLLEKSGRKIIIRKNAAGLNQIHLLVTMNGLVDYLSNINLSGRDSAIVMIPVNDVPSGILTITVLDNQWNPLTERVSFVRNNTSLKSNPKISVTKKDVQKRGYNTIDLSYDDSTIANLSIAITDADLPADTSSDIISYLLLSDELKGKVNHPAYYFSDTSYKLQEQLDLVMLTNGWRRYQWKQIIAGVSPKVQYPADSNYFFFAGKIENRKKMPQKVSFMVKNKEELAGYTLPVMPGGNFADSSMILFDSVAVAYQPAQKKENIPMDFNQLPLPVFNIYPFHEALSEPASDKYVKQTPDTSAYFVTSKNMLATVTVFTPKKNPIDKIEDKYTTGAFRNQDGFRLDLEDNPTLFNNTSIIDMLKGRIPHFNDDLTNPPYFFVDEVREPLDAVEQLTFAQIAFVKYYSSHFILSPGGGGQRGTVAIYTKKFSAEDLREHSHEGTYHIHGYTIAKEFYSPDYRMSAADSIINDRRKTLFWEPLLQMGTGNKNSGISFYNNDIAKRFRVMIEGMKSDGSLIHVEKIIE
jgi:hypothetical protein